MSDHQFTIGEFSLSREVDVVPKSWLTKDGNCWWPNVKNSAKVKTFVKNAAVPDSKSYKLYPFRVFRHYSTYEAARVNVSRAQEDSDLNSGPEGPARDSRLRARIPNNVPSDSSSSEEDNSRTHGHISGNVILPPPPPPPCTAVNTPRSGTVKGLDRKTVKRNLFGESSQMEDVIPRKRPSHVLGLVGASDNTRAAITSMGEVNEPEIPDHVRRDSPQGSLEVPEDREVDTGSTARHKMKPNENFQAWVVRSLDLIKLQLNQVQESIDILVRGKGCETLPGGIIPEDDFKLLPCKSVEDVEVVCKLLEDATKQKQLVSRLSLRSDSSLSECVRRVLQGLLTDDAAINFNWKGSRGEKRGFKESNLLSVVYGAVRSHSKWKNSDEKEMESVIKGWFRNASKRITSKQKKSTVNDAEADDDAISNDGSSFDS